MRSVVFALMMREMKTRFGNYRLGYFWALLEPGIHLTIFVVMFGVIMGRTMPGVDYTLFVITGIIPWLMFSDMLSRGMTAVSANVGLFSYRQVKPMDSFVARMILEGLIHIATYLLFLLIMSWVGKDISIKDPLGIFAAMALLFLFSFGIALTLCVVVTQYPEVQKFIPIVTRPLYFVSGIFFSTHTVPQQYRTLLLWNPVLQSNELARGAFFHNYPATDASWEYLALCAILATAFGLALYRQNTERLLAT